MVSNERRDNQICIDVYIELKCHLTMEIFLWKITGFPFSERQFRSTGNRFWEIGPKRVFRRAESDRPILHCFPNRRTFALDAPRHSKSKAAWLILRRVLYNTLLEHQYTNLLTYSNIWMFLPSRPRNELFHYPVTYKYITILGIRSAYISCYYVGQTLGKLSGCHEQPLLTSYAYNLNMLVNRSIANM